ncbi:hypothetical protein QVD17_30912 [Tagetes erecta]|uniref:Uncharacterized protein n=1 Tax=Tagetes erecta TaxID=13708 RepID=A0AAD8NGG9_TARER|nr:hypothetical protein QVD17_30912 [Tagetes erecta]
MPYVPYYYYYYSPPPPEPSSAVFGLELMMVMQARRRYMLGRQGLDRIKSLMRIVSVGDTGTHIPVMLGEVLQVFDFHKVHMFVDCNLGAGIREREDGVER